MIENPIPNKLVIKIINMISHLGKSIGPAIKVLQNNPIISGIKKITVKNPYMILFLVFIVLFYLFPASRIGKPASVGT